MSHPTSPAAVVRGVVDGVSRLVAGGLDAAAREEQLDRLAALYAERTDVRHPFSPFADPPLTTRAELRAHFAAGSGRVKSPERYEPVAAHVHETADPEVVVFEFCYAGSIDGRSFSLPCIFVVRVRDGEIVESRDYSNTIAFARTFGHVDALVTAVTAERPPAPPG